MATHDYVIDNQSAPALRADLNSALQAIVTQNASATAPTVTYPNMIWYDTANNQIKKRNEADSAWITLGTVDEGTGLFNPNMAFASQAEAEAGTNNTKSMTPLRTAQAIAALGGVSNYQVFTASGTWTKPTAPASAIVLIEAWGGGGGGGPSSFGAGRSGGGGGGAYSSRLMRISDLGATVSVTVGAGGAIGSAGGNSSFGTHVTAYGGGTQTGTAYESGGGGGGGELVVGGSSSSTAGGLGGRVGGGTGGVGASSVTAAGAAGANAGTLWGGGGGGGGGNTGTGGTGGSAVYGGGGGSGFAASGGGGGGTSLYGGAGGSTQYIAGTAPAGGGGATAAGARGEVRVTVF